MSPALSVPSSVFWREAFVSGWQRAIMFRAPAYVCRPVPRHVRPVRLHRPPRARGPQISITLIWIYRPKLHPLADNSPPHISIPIKTPYGAAAAMHPALQACGPALPVLLSSGLKKLWTAPKSKLPVRIWAPATLFGPLGSCHLAGPSHPMNFVFFNAFSLVIEYWLLHWSFASVILCSNFKGHLKSMMLFSSENFARIQAICTIIIIIVIIYISYYYVGLNIVWVVTISF